MAEIDYTDQELDEYFSYPEARHSNGHHGDSEGDHRRRVRKLAWWTVLVLFLMTLIPAIGLGIYFFSLSDETPPLEDLVNPDVSLASRVYTSDGTVLARYAYEDRTPVPFDSISPHMVHALVAREDFRFEKHWGMDVFRTFAAVYHTIRGDRQGGSTLTQQLARNLYQEQVGNSISVTRKVKEMFTAIQLERNYTKQEILEMYLNTVTFGNNTYGIQTAALTYFGVPASQLSMDQSAVLVAILKGTSVYNPLRYPDRVVRQRNIVINQMVAFGDLATNVADTLKQLPLGLNYSPMTHTENAAPFFTEQVRLFVDKWAAENGYNTYRDGLVIHTTLDSRMQAHAQKAADAQLAGLQTVANVEHSKFGAGKLVKTFDAARGIEDREGFKPFNAYVASNRAIVDEWIEGSDRYKQMAESGSSRKDAIKTLRATPSFMDSLIVERTRLEVGFLAMDPNTREVKAWVGGRDFKTGKYDHVSDAKRQPGSLFKMFLYTAAIDNGFSPHSRYKDDSVTVVRPGMPEPWTPKNSSNTFSGEMLTLRECLRRSINSCAAQLVDDVGPEQVVEYAKRMGVKSPLQANPSIALGTNDATLYEVTNAYATLANGGFEADPIFISRIEDNSGKVLADFRVSPKEVLSANSAYTMIDMLRGVVDQGTGVNLRPRFGIDKSADLAGKTGTTQEGADGWFALMHPQLVMGSWVGFNDRRVTFRTSYWGQGGRNALYVVGDFFKSVFSDPDIALPKNQFMAPPGWYVPVPMFELEEEETNKLNSDKKGKLGW